MNLKDLQYLKYLNSVKVLTIVFLVCLTIYLIVKSPSIETTTKIQLDGLIVDSISTDTLKKDLKCP